MKCEEFTIFFCFFGVCGDDKVQCVKQYVFCTELIYWNVAEGDKVS